MLTTLTESGSGYDLTLSAPLTTEKMDCWASFMYPGVCFPPVDPLPRRSDNECGFKSWLCPHFLVFQLKGSVYKITCLTRLRLLVGPQLPLAPSSFLSKVADCVIASGKVGICVRVQESWEWWEFFLPNVIYQNKQINPESLTEGKTTCSCS